MLTMKITIKKMRDLRMYNPPHPGEILRLLCLEPLGLSVTKAAKALDVSRSALSSLLHGRTSGRLGRAIHPPKGRTQATRDPRD